MSREFSFGQWLQQRRRAMDFTQEVLAEHVACSVDTIRKIERGARRPSRQIAERLAQVLEIPAEEWDRFVLLVRHHQQDGPTLQVPPLPPVSQGSPNNLPLPLTALIGRESALRELAHLVSTVRLVTLAGVGGVGKTRLAIQVATELLNTFAHGAWFVDLASLTDPALVTKAVAAVLGVSEEPGEPLMTTLLRFLEAKHTLLVFDNCEHLIGACAQLCEFLLQAAPHLHILATSRELLGVPGEHIYPLDPLAIPDREKPPGLEAMLGYGSVQLFVERARAVQPDYTLTADNAPAVAEICSRLDGLPLALELAAARIRLLPAEHIVAQLDGRFRLLTAGSRTAAPRHQTLQSLIDWSYALLSTSEQFLFQRLAVFAGGWTLQAAGAVCYPPDEWPDQALEGMASLVDKSLVRPAGEVCGEPRFTMLETMRAYGLERLAADEDGPAVRRAYARFFLTLAEAAEQKREGPRQGMWLERLEAEHGNLRTALRWSIDQDEAEMALRLAGALWWFWQIRGHFGEGRRWLEKTLTLSRPGELRARVLTGAGTLAWCQGAYQQASRYHQEALALYREAGDASGVAFALNNLGVQALCQGNYAQAAALYEESLDCYRHIGDPHSVSLALNNLGVVAQYQGHYQRAAELYQESLALRRELGDKKRIADGLFNLGEVASLQGKTEQAANLYCESLLLWQELGAKEGIARCLAGLGGVIIALGRLEEGAQLCSAAQALFDDLGLLLDPTERDLFERNVAATRIALDAARFDAAWRSGQGLKLDEAIEQAVAMAPEQAPSAPTDGAAGSEPADAASAVGVTRREEDVLRLLATGLTDRQIAEQLCISPRTVGKHLQSIYRKLGVESRSGATRIAVEHNLT